MPCSIGMPIYQLVQRCNIGATGSGEMICTLNHTCASASESNPVFSKHLKQSQTYYRHHYCQTRNKIGQIRTQNGSDIHSLVALGSKNHNYLLTGQIIFCRSRKERVNFRIMLNLSQLKSAPRLLFNASLNQRCEKSTVHCCRFNETLVLKLYPGLIIS